MPKKMAWETAEVKSKEQQKMLDGYFTEPSARERLGDKWEDKAVLEHGCLVEHGRHPNLDEYDSL